MVVSTLPVGTPTMSGSSGTVGLGVGPGLLPPGLGFVAVATAINAIGTVATIRAVGREPNTFWKIALGVTAAGLGLGAVFGIIAFLELA